jgi:ABC-type molybdate transport system permease subunit
VAGAGRSRSAKTPVTALVALPIVLPPTVLGFYLLIALGPKSPLMACCIRSGSAPWPSPSRAW